jgi:1-acyl-sn-glycerol-3-phosphate acyltransferase
MLYNFSIKVVWVIMHILFRIDIKGQENIPSDGALICPNHYSLLDPVLIAICMSKHKIRFMAKHEVFKNPLANFYLRKVGVYPVKRGEPDINSIKTTLRLLKGNELVGLFPEGTRSKTGELGPANPGVALFAIKSGKPVIPVAITGRYKLFSKVKVNYGQPLDLAQYKKDKMTNEDYYEISQLVMAEIKQLKGDATCKL